MLIIEHTGKILNFRKKNRPKEIFSKHFELIHLTDLRFLRHFSTKSSFFHLFFHLFSSLSLFLISFIFSFIFSLLLHLVSSLFSLHTETELTTQMTPPTEKTAMNHDPLNQERAINLSNLTMSEHGEFSSVESN